ncbi:MAG: Asp-tRNA(Asn)/Glu-tRNA(Gln) amidotransferase GatCAB subunit A, partial [Flavobacteriales bacterium CG18_big_fil_WC_8_21_14_2_50_32_9]
LVKETYSQIEKLDSKLHSFITIKDKSVALKEAEEKDKIRKNDSSIVFGLPFAVKDAYVTKDLQTTAGSKLLENFNSPYNAT